MNFLLFVIILNIFANGDFFSILYIISFLGYACVESYVVPVEYFSFLKYYSLSVIVLKFVF